MGLERGLNCSRHSAAVSYIITPVTTDCDNSEMYVALGGANTTGHIKIGGRKVQGKLRTLLMISVAHASIDNSAPRPG